MSKLFFSILEFPTISRHDPCHLMTCVLSKKHLWVKLNVEKALIFIIANYSNHDWRICFGSSSGLYNWWSFNKTLCRFPSRSTKVSVQWPDSNWTLNCNVTKSWFLSMPTSLSNKYWPEVQLICSHFSFLSGALTFHCGNCVVFGVWRQ